MPCHYTEAYNTVSGHIFTMLSRISTEKRTCVGKSLTCLDKLTRQFKKQYDNTSSLCPYSQCKDIDSLVCSFKSTGVRAQRTLDSNSQHPLQSTSMRTDSHTVKLVSLQHHQFIGGKESVIMATFNDVLKSICTFALLRFCHVIINKSI